MFKLSCIAILLVTTLFISNADNTYGRLVQQKPLLFGRRGMSPNMNSLFFGKRASLTDIQQAYDDDEMCSLCKMVQPTCSLCLKDPYIALGDEKWTLQIKVMYALFILL